MVDRWRAARIKSGVKPASVNRNTNDLKAMLNFALLRGLISAHPMQTVKNLREESESRIRYLTPPEETRLRTALDARETMKRESRERGNQWRIERSHDPRADLRVVAFVDYLKPAVLLSLNTGLRQGEVFKLTWPSVNLEKGMVTVTASSAKSQKSRHVPLNAEAKAVLKAWQEQGSGEGYVFPSRDGGPLSEIKTAWLKLLRDADIKNFRWHDMRHHFASRLVMAGVDLNTVRELLGHSDIKMTLRYAHLAPEHKRAAVELISGSSNVTPVKKRRSKSTTKPPERE
jgi:integrase